MIVNDSVTTQVRATKQTITRTIHYLDSQNLQPIAGVSSVVQQVTYGLLTIVASDGTVMGYDTDGDGRVDTCNRAQAWLLVGSAPWFTSVRSPDLSQQDYAAPDLRVVPQQMVTSVDDQDVTVNVYYRLATKTIHNYRTKRRTVSYIDRWTHQAIAPKVQQLVVYHQMMIIEKRTGKILGYDLNDDGHVDTGLSDRSWLRVGNDHFDPIVSPDLTDEGYTKPNINALTSQVVTIKTPELASYTINYGHQRFTVSPEKPGIPGQLIDERYPKLTYPIRSSRPNLIRSISRTINYVDSNGSTVAAQVRQSTSFHRSAQIDVVTGRLTFQSWQVVDTDTMPAVISPHLTGQAPDVVQVSELTVDPMSHSQQVTVTYRQDVTDDALEKSIETGHSNMLGAHNAKMQSRVASMITTESKHNEQQRTPYYGDDPDVIHHSKAEWRSIDHAHQQPTAHDSANQTSGIGWVNAAFSSTEEPAKSKRAADTCANHYHRNRRSLNQVVRDGVRRVLQWWQL